MSRLNDTTAGSGNSAPLGSEAKDGGATRIVATTAMQNHPECRWLILDAPGVRAGGVRVTAGNTATLSRPAAGHKTPFGLRRRRFLRRRGTAFAHLPQVKCGQSGGWGIR